MKILISAYACSPYKGSEPGMAWHWCKELAKYCELFIITEEEFREDIMYEVSRLPQGGNMHFYFNPVPEKVRKMCWNQGDWRFYIYYKQWQKRTLAIAKDICSRVDIDVLHQLNMIGFREPGYLWKIKDIPLVWGPVGCTAFFPFAYLKGMSWKDALFILLKVGITRGQMMMGRRLRKMKRRAQTVITASSVIQVSFNQYMGVSSIMINETGCSMTDDQVEIQRASDEMHLLWVGRNLATKRLDIAMQTVAQLQEKQQVKLHIVGGGFTEADRLLAQRLGIGDNCIFHGLISHDEVQQLMRKCDLFFFTSLVEGTPHVVLEAISNHVPILCFDTCGQGDIVTDKVGFKIPLSSPEESVRQFASIIDRVMDNKTILDQFKPFFKEKQKKHTWEKKVENMLTIYESVVKMRQKVD